MDGESLSMDGDNRKGIESASNIDGRVGISAQWKSENNPMDYYCERAFARRQLFPVGFCLKEVPIVTLLEETDGWRNHYVNRMNSLGIIVLEVKMKELDSDEN